MKITKETLNSDCPYREEYIDEKCIESIYHRTDYCYAPPGKPYYISYDYYGYRSGWTDRKGINELKSKMGDKLIEYPDKRTYINKDKVTNFSAFKNSLDGNMYGLSLNIGGRQRSISYEIFLFLKKMMPTKAKIRKI